MLQIISLIVGFLLVHLKIFKPPRGNALYCGICGFNGPRPVDITKLRWLLAENQYRGIDSTGVYGNHLYKDKVRAKEFILSKGFVAAVKGARSVIAHTRAATVGSVTADNAHPFAYGEGEWRTVGTHNGFVIPELIPYYKGNVDILPKDFNMEVDSQILFAALAHKQDVDVISKIEGGMAIGFMFPNQSKDTLYLYKREETRPLYIGEASDGLYYSSIDDPLKYIGCSNIFQILPNTLYTLTKGQISDMYRMPDAVLKSLSADVQRLSWRTGVPIAEINALPVDVGIQKTHTASYKGGGGNYNQKQLGFGSNWNRNWDESADGDSSVIDLQTRGNIAKNYNNGNLKSTDSVEARYRMLIRTIQSELKLMDCQILLPQQQTSRSSDDMSSCLLCVRLKNKDNGKDLMAWSVLTENDPDISGVTSPSGLCVMKVPYAKCNQDIQLHVYDPVDSLGHFVFTVKPEAGRVMEVTLSIPFLKEEEEEGAESAYKSSTMESFKALSGRGGSGHPLHSDGIEFDGIYEQDKGSHPFVLREQSRQIPGGYQRQQTDGSQAEAGYSRKLIPQTSSGTVGNLDTIIPKMIPTLANEEERLKKIQELVEIDYRGLYCNWTPPPLLWGPTINSEGYKRWKNIYETQFGYKIFDVNSLILDAARLQCWDRHATKWWYKFHDYIECLLRTFPSYYIRDEWRKSNPYVAYNMFYPSTLLAAALTPKEKPVRELPYRTFSMFLNWRCTFKFDLPMTEKNLKELQIHSDRIHELVDSLNEILAKSEHTETAAGQELRETVILTRNFLRHEKEDLDDFISKATFELNQTPVS